MRMTNLSACRLEVFSIFTIRLRIVAFCHLSDDGHMPLDMMAQCHYCSLQMAITESDMQKTIENQQMVKLNIRLPHELRLKLKIKARREGRSMNAQAVQILSKILIGEGREAA